MYATAVTTPQLDLLDDLTEALGTDCGTASGMRLQLDSLSGEYAVTVWERGYDPHSPGYETALWSSRLHGTPQQTENAVAVAMPYVARHFDADHDNFSATQSQPPADLPEGSVFDPQRFQTWEINDLDFRTA